MGSVESFHRNQILSFYLTVFGGLHPKVTFPYLIECPFEGIVPTSVSLVELPCDYAENNLEILDVQPVDGIKKRFGVCSKSARYEKRSFAIRFIEWVHMVRLLGAEKIHFSYEYVHPELLKIIRYFEKKGIIETWQYLNPSGIQNSGIRSVQGLALEVNAQTDCFYRVKNLYDYVAIIDFDELIMPVMDEDMTWDDIIRRANSSEYIDAYISQNAYYPEVGTKFIDQIPHFMYMLQHTERSKNFSKRGYAIKTLFGTERVLTVHTHMPYHCIAKTKHFCRKVHLPTNISQNSHYRATMDKEFFEVTQADKIILKYREKLIWNVKKTLEETQFFP